jgi:hypothetical protein
VWIRRQTSDGGVTTLRKNHITPLRQSCNALKSELEKTEQKILNELSAWILTNSKTLGLLDIGRCGQDNRRYRKSRGRRQEIHSSG